MHVKVGQCVCLLVVIPANIYSFHRKRKSLLALSVWRDSIELAKRMFQGLHACMNQRVVFGMMLSRYWITKYS